MGCIPRAKAVLLLFILLTQRLPSVRNTAQNGNALQETKSESKKFPHRDNVIIKTISIIFELISDMDRALNNDFTTRVFYMLEEIISELSQLGEINIVRDLRNLALQHILVAKRELANVVQSMDETSRFVNRNRKENLLSNTHRRFSFNEKQRFMARSRLFSNACQAVDNLINLSTSGLHDCCNITVKPMISLCRSLQYFLFTASDYIAEIDHMLDRVQVCLENKLGSVEYRTRCLNFAYNEITNLIHGLEKILRKLTRLLHLKMLYSRSSLSLAIVEINEKNKNIYNEY